jgi:hypothetical protein
MASAVARCAEDRATDVPLLGGGGRRSKPLPALAAATAREARDSRAPEVPLGARSAKRGEQRVANTPGSPTSPARGESRREPRGAEGVDQFSRAEVGQISRALKTRGPRRSRPRPSPRSRLRAHLGRYVHVDDAPTATSQREPPSPNGSRAGHSRLPPLAPPLPYEWSHPPNSPDPSVLLGDLWSTRWVPTGTCGVHAAYRWRT